MIETKNSKPLTFITCGSVDDGKSTLIGRLLYESKSLLSDQISAIANAKHQRTVAGQLDLSLITDGLEAEREQGITIDVAYRYFATPVRKFIIADTPGHEQYTRNMVTGASQADAAILLIDASRIFNESVDNTSTVTLATQTRRHAAIVKLMGVKHIAVAINKLDLLAFSKQKFEQVRDAFAVLATELGVSTYSVFPVSALAGDNIVEPSLNTPWYTGPSLLSWLEQLESRDHSVAEADEFRLSVQWVIRANGASADAQRRLAGRVSAGHVEVGQTINIFPSGQSAVVTQLLIGEKLIQRANTGDSISVELDRDVDVSRGDWLTSAEDASGTKLIHADICWLDHDSMKPQTKYWLKHGTQSSLAKIGSIDDRLNLQSGRRERHEAPYLANDIGCVQINVQKALWFAPHAHAEDLGRFVLIDPATHRTVAAGLVR